MALVPVHGPGDSADLSSRLHQPRRFVLVGFVRIDDTPVTEEGQNAARILFGFLADDILSVGSCRIGLGAALCKCRADNLPTLR